jgi:hypothetical protein
MRPIEPGTRVILTAVEALFIMTVNDRGSAHGLG